MGAGCFFLVGRDDEDRVVTFDDLDRWLLDHWVIISWCRAPNRHVAGMLMPHPDAKPKNDETPAGRS